MAAVSMGGGSIENPTPLVMGSFPAGTVDAATVDADVTDLVKGAGVDLTVDCTGSTKGAGVDLTVDCTGLTEGADVDLMAGLGGDWFATNPSVCVKSKTNTPIATQMMVSAFCLCILLFGRNLRMTPYPLNRSCFILLFSNRI
jgi:hypothetical protein